MKYQCRRPDWKRSTGQTTVYCQGTMLKHTVPPDADVPSRAVLYKCNVCEREGWWWPLRKRRAT